MATALKPQPGTDPLVAARALRREALGAMLRRAGELAGLADPGAFQRRCFADAAFCEAHREYFKGVWDEMVCDP